MLADVCEKAGLPDDAWLRADADVVTFETERFGGPALATPGAGAVTDA
jgi:AMMECR1 domain-containing protein